MMYYINTMHGTPDTFIKYPLLVPQEQININNVV